MRDASVLLRPATADDAAWLAALVRADAVAGTLATDAAERLVAAARAPAADDAEVLVLEVRDGTPAGVVCWRLTNRRSRIALVHTLVVDPAAQGRGVVVAALRALVERLIARGVHRVEAETYGCNTTARRAFVAAGFAEEGVRRQAYDRHGAWQDGVLLGLVADPSTPGSGAPNLPSPD